MPKKKIDYAAMYSFDAKTGLYYAKRTIDGKVKKFKSKDPEKLHEKINKALSAGPYVPTFREVAEEWHDEKWPTIQAKTWGCYEAPYRRAVDEYGDRLITEIQPAEIQRTIMRMKDQGYAQKTVKTQLGVLRMILSHAVVHDPPYILSNPAEYVTIPRGLPKTKRSAPEDDVMQIIMDSVDTAYFGLFPYLLLYTGCRRGEALALTWGDIDFKGKTISITKEIVYTNGLPTVKSTKTEAGVRTVPLLPALCERLEARLTDDSTGYIFQSPDGRPMQENAFRRHWAHYCKDAGLVRDEPETKTRANGTEYQVHHYKPTITPHMIRHGYSTILYEAGVDAKTAQSLMGHADIHTTLQIYTDIREKHRAAEIGKLTEYMGKLESGKS